jgi:hypothetical protein
MSTFVGGVNLPAISQQFIDELEKAFPGPTVQVGFDRDQALFDAGCAYVVEWIKKKAAIKQGTSGDPVKAQQAMVRYGQ